MKRLSLVNDITHAFNLIRHVNILQDHTLIAMKGRNLLLQNTLSFFKNCTLQSKIEGKSNLWKMFIYVFSVQIKEITSAKQ